MIRPAITDRVERGAERLVPALNEFEGTEELTPVELQVLREVEGEIVIGRKEKESSIDGDSEVGDER